MSHARALVAGSAALLALTACGGGSTTPTAASSAPAQASSAPARSAAPASSAPASSAPASSAGGSGSSAGKPSTPATELPISGTVAGLSFTTTTAQDRQKSGGLTQMTANAKVEPASCQKVLKYSQATDPMTSGGATATGDPGVYGVGVGNSAVPVKQMKDDLKGCPKMTMDLGGMKITIESTMTDVNVPNVSNGYRVVQSFDVAGQKQQNIAINGEVRGLVVSSFGMQGADSAKVDEVFKAQVDKVAKAK